MSKKNVLLFIEKVKKKTVVLLSILLFTLSAHSLYSQVNSYSFSENLVGYTPLTGGTVAYTAPWDDHAVGAAVQVTMPFTFRFDYNPYTQFYISPNGFITFGATQPASTNYIPIQNTTAHNGVISAMGTDLVSNGFDITYGVVGTAPNRTMVVQWQNVVRKTAGGDFNFQIRLNEADNSVELSYGLCSPLGTTIIGVQVGLRGNTNSYPQGDIFNRLQGSSATWFGTTINGVANSSTVRTVNTSAAIQAYPDLGLQYRYVPAPLCVTPPAQPTGLVIGSTSVTHNSFVGNTFTAASPAPTNYLVVRSLVNTPPTAAQIVNGVYYPAGTPINPTYMSAANITGTSFTQTGLTANTTYYYWIVPYNDLCGGAPTYNLSGIISASQTTCSPATTTTAATNLTGNSFDANWTAVAGATNYFIDVATDNAFTSMVPGYSNLSVGLVTTYNVSGLLPLTTYYYRVRAVGIGCVSNSNTTTVVNPCGYYTIPYVQNFDTFATGIIPPCYVRDNANADGFQWQTQSLSFSSASRSMHMAKNPALAMDDWFFMPGLYLNSGTSYRLFFRYNTGNTGTQSENLRVRLGSGASSAAMTETLLDFNAITNNQFQIAIVDFTPVTSGVYYIGFYGNSLANQSFIAIDDISVTVSPSCFEPSDVTVVSTGTNNALISWTASSPATAGGYEYYVSTSNTAPNAATVPSGSVGAGITSVNITGLTASTTYYVWIRGNCNASGKSVWTPEESFSTDCNTPIVTATTGSTRCGYGTLTISATPNAGSSINWYTVATGGVPIATTNSYTTPALNTTTTYYAEAKAFGPVAKVGPSNPTNQGGVFGVLTSTTAVNFSITANTTLQSIDIFPMVSGQTGTLVVRNSSNLPLGTYTFTTTASGGNTAQVISVNKALTPGNYNLYFSALPASGLRMNVSNSFYPYTSTVANILGNNIDNTYYVGMYNWKFTTECLSPRIAVNATVTSPPALGISAAGSVICEGDSTTPVTITGYGAYNNFVWSPNTNVSGSLASGFTFNPSTTTTYTLLATQTSGSLCGNTITHTVTVNPAPAAIAIIPPTVTICQNSIQSLTGSASAASASVIFSDNFNAATNSWTVANTSIGGDVLASQWTLRPDNYNYVNGFGWNVTFHSNDNTQFYLANSDSQSGSPGTLTRTTLTSPSFSLAGFIGASLNFYHFLRYTAFDTVLIEASIDGGTTWSTIKQYTGPYGLQGQPVINLVSDTVDMNAYAGNPNVKIRFNYTSPWGYVWAIDNVAVSGVLATALTWSPTTNLYSNAAATIPYVAGTPATVVYTKPSSTITYTATSTGANGCFRTQNVTINVTPLSNGGVVSPDQNTCSGLGIVNMTLTGNVGNVVRWEYADDAAFTIGVTPIANTTTTLTPAQMGVFSTTRYFRAVVRNGICSDAYSNVAYVTSPSTTWNGSSWSNGAPDSSTLAIFAGNYSSTGNLNACSIRVNSGNVVVNPGHTFIVENGVNVVGGTLVFENAASLVQVNNVSNSGNITVKRNTTPMTRFDYTYWSTPVSPQTLTSLSPLTLSDKYFIYSPVVGNWVQVPSFNLMDVARGYIIRAPQTFSTSVPSVYNASFFGTPNNGTYTIPIQLSTSQFNLIGNPYPSAINADLLLSDSANVPVIDASIYLWTHNTPITNNQYTSNDYAVYNYMGGTGTSSATNSGVNNSIPTGKIASGQSFFVKALSNGNAVFKNSMRVVGNNNQFFRMENQEATSIGDFEKHRFWIDISGSSNQYKQVLLGYCQNATSGLDRGFDSEFFPIGNSLSIYSILEDVKLSIQGQSLDFNTSDQFPLGYTAAADGEYRIGLHQYDGLFEQQAIYLWDTYMNTITNLKDGVYTFSTTAGIFENRFVIVFTDQVLNSNEFEPNSNQIIIYKPDASIKINSGTLMMSSVQVFDARGREIEKYQDINASELTLKSMQSNQVLLFKITTRDGLVFTKTYIN